MRKSALTDKATMADPAFVRCNERAEGVRHADMPWSVRTYFVARSRSSSVWIAMPIGPISS